MSVKGVLLDFDGTVGNTANLILTSFRYATTKVMGKVFPDDVYIKTFGLPLVQCMELVAEKTEQVEPLLSVYREFNISNHDRLITIFPGVREALEELQKRGVRLAIVTSKKRDLCQRGLDVLGLSSYIDALVSCDELTQSKPAADPMLKGAKALGLLPEECLCVGDSYFDLQSGHNAHCAANIGVSYSFLPLEELQEKGQPEFIVDDLRELLVIIDKLNQETLEV